MTAMTADVLAELRHDHAHEAAELAAYRQALTTIGQLVEAADTAAFEGGQFTFDVLALLVADIRAAMPKPGDGR